MVSSRLDFTERFFISAWHARLRESDLYPSPLDRFVATHLLTAPQEFKRLLERNNFSCKPGQESQGELMSIVIVGACEVCGRQVLSEVWYPWQVGKILESGLVHQRCEGQATLEESDEAMI